LKVEKYSATKAEVKDILHNKIKHVVNIATRECTCLRWQHTREPCWYALVFLIEKRNVPLENYVKYYLLEGGPWLCNVSTTFKGVCRKAHKNMTKSFLEGASMKSKEKGNEKEKNCWEARLDAKKCGVLGHRQNNCPTNGTRKGTQMCFVSFHNKFSS
jgi:hypothetical protein